MRDKRPVDELSIEELERILAIRKREARLAQLHRYETGGRRIAGAPEPERAARTAQRLARRMPGSRQPDFVEHDAVGDFDETGEPDHTQDIENSPDAANGSAKPPVYFEGEPQFEDELDRQFTSQHSGRGPVSRRRLWNRALLLVEVGATLTLIFLAVNLFLSVQAISQSTAREQADYEATNRAAYVPPTATPMINIAAIILPSGHRYTEQGGEFNTDEIPVQYRDQVLSYLAQLPAQRPTPSAEGPIRIRVPRIGVDKPVVYGDDWEALKLGVGHHVGSANPGQRGNVVLTAHNDVYGEIFRYLDKMQPGDEITVSTRSRDYVYVVQPVTQQGSERGYQLVNPTDVWVLGQGGDNKRLTLISCYPYRVDNKRIIVFATLKA